MIKKTVCGILGILGLNYFIGCAHFVVPQDISPDFSNGSIMDGANAPAGVISELAGSEAELYAVGLNSGIWKSNRGGRWVQLPNSPRYASTVDVSPVNASHIVVGEHDGEADDPKCNRTGVWESFDSGANWQLTWMPDSPDSDKRNIKALTFTPLGTVLFAAEGGVYRRTIIPASSDNCLRPPYCYESVTLPSGVREVVALAVSRAKYQSTTWIVWGLAKSNVWNEPGKVLWSLDDGQTWNAEAIPQKFGMLDVTLGNITTITGFGTTAVFPCRISKTTNPLVFDHLPYCCGDNTCMLLYYSIDKKEFRSQVLMLKLENNSDEAKSKATFGDGTGLGGCQRIRTFTTGSSWPDKEIGKKVRIFYNVGQEVLSAKYLKNTDLLEWECIALTQATGREGTKDPVHCDVWDVHYDHKTQNIRLATDGGVFKKRLLPPSSASAMLGDESWVTHNSGLHTQHVHTLVVLNDQIRDHRTPNIAYVTHDNDAWYRDNAVSSWSDDWDPVGMFGDADCVDGDQVLPNIALLWRVEQWMSYVDFGKGKPEGATSETPKAMQAFVPFYGGRKAGNKDAFCDRLIFPRSFKVIQTPKGESPQPLLDLVALVKYPLYSWSTTTSKTVFSPDNPDLFNATTLPSDSMMLLRNTSFLAKPSAVDEDPQSGWKHVAPDVTLPDGTNSVWVSNGHQDPVYYLLANDKTDTTVWKLEKVGGKYTLIQLKGIGSDVLDPAGGYGKVGFGPLYVDPYDPDHVFVFTEDGIRVSPAGQKVGQDTKFVLDEVLTKLVSESVTYNWKECYWGGPVSDAYKHAMGTSTFVIAGVAFNRDHPHHVAVSSPVAGLFVSTDEDRHWLSLNDYLPAPFTQIAGVVMEGENLYAALEGRGLWRFMHYENAKPASYFEVHPKISGSRKIYLFNSDSKHITDAQVSVTLVLDGEEKEFAYTTDHNGLLTLPKDYFNEALHLKFEGDSQAAGCRVSISPN